MSNYTDGMSMEEQTGQTLMVGFPGTTASREVLELIQRYHVGNILLFSRNVRDAEQVRELTRHLQEAAREAQEYLYQAIRQAFRPGMGAYLPDRFFWAREDEESAAPPPVSADPTRHKPSRA